MDVYNFHPETGEYLGTSQADPNPVRPDNWLVPAFATRAPPPAAAKGFARVWTGGQWRQAPDHRGEQWWPKDAANNLAPSVTIDYLGDPTEKDLTSVEPPAPPQPPVSVDARQIRIAMTQFGWRTAVEAYVAGADQDTKDTWQYGTRFGRQDKFVFDLAGALPKTDEDTDALFDLAKTL